MKDGRSLSETAVSPLSRGATSSMLFRQAHLLVTYSISAALSLIMTICSFVFKTIAPSPILPRRIWRSAILRIKSALVAGFLVVLLFFSFRIFVSGIEKLKSLDIYIISYIDMLVKEMW